MSSICNQVKHPYALGLRALQSLIKDGGMHSLFDDITLRAIKGYHPDGSGYFLAPANSDPIAIGTDIEGNKVHLEIDRMVLPSRPMSEDELSYVLTPDITIGLEYVSTETALDLVKEQQASIAEYTLIPPEHLSLTAMDGMVTAGVDVYGDKFSREYVAVVYLSDKRTKTFYPVQLETGIPTRLRDLTPLKLATIISSYMQEALSPYVECVTMVGVSEGTGVPYIHVDYMGKNGIVSVLKIVVPFAGGSSRGPAYSKNSPSRNRGSRYDRVGRSRGDYSR